MICEHAYVLRIEGREVPPYEQFPFQDETTPPFAVLESAWQEQASHTRNVIAAIRDWRAPLEYVTTRGEKPMIVTATPGDLFTQLALHKVHHRAQVMNMLRQLGVALADIDYDSIMFQRREA